MKSALITGITGQDGSYLAELLFKNGYKVHGIIRDASQKWRIKHIEDEIVFHKGDLLDEEFTKEILDNIGADEIYHLASIVDGRPDVSEIERDIFKVNLQSTHVLLKQIKDVCPKSKFYLAGTSLSFGKPNISPQNELTPFNPDTPYGIAKTASTSLVKMYRETHGLFACTGILYNHESPRRSPNFLPRKITISAAKIKLKMENELLLGDIDAIRDWGFAGDFVRSMWFMLQQAEPADFVIGTGMAHTVRDILKIAFSYLGLNWEDYVKIDPKLVRQAERYPLVADIRKAAEKLLWYPEVSFEKLIEMMVEIDFRNLKNGLSN